ncbi:MAG: peptidylprolyl isomerase [Gammaproteobacteria bacterium]
MRNIILIVTLSFFCSFLANAAPQKLDKIVAVVNSDVITQHELDFRMGLVKNQIGAASQLPSDEVLSEQVLDRMIEQTLVEQAAARSGIVVTELDLRQAVESIAKQNRMTVDELKNTLAQDGISYEKFQEDLKAQVTASRAQQRLIGSSIRLSDAEIDHWVAQNKNRVESQRQYLFGHILIALPKDPTPEQIEEANKRAAQALAKLKEHGDFRKVALTYSDSSDVLEKPNLGWRYAHELPSLLSDVAPTLEKGDVRGPLRNGSGLHIVELLDVKDSEAPKQWVEETHARHILVALNEVRDEKKALERMNEVMAKLESGADFAVLAKEYSDDPGSKQSGGDLGFVQPKSLTPKFAETMTSLKVGERSKPVLTPFGWHVIEVIDRQQREVSHELLRAEIQEKLYQRKLNEALQNWYTQLRDQAQVQTYL